MWVVGLKSTCISEQTKQMEKLADFQQELLILYYVYALSRIPFWKDEKHELINKLKWSLTGKEATCFNPFSIFSASDLIQLSCQILVCNNQFRNQVCQT